MISEYDFSRFPEHDPLRDECQNYSQRGMTVNLVASIGIPDVLLTLEEGTHFLVQPVSSAGKEWVSENVWPDYGEVFDEPEYNGAALVVNRDRLYELFDGMADSGLKVR